MSDLTIVRSAPIAKPIDSSRDRLIVRLISSRTRNELYGSRRVFTGNMVLNFTRYSSGKVSIGLRERNLLYRRKMDTFYRMTSRFEYLT